MSCLTTVPASLMGPIPQDMKTDWSVGIGRSAASPATKK